MPTNERFSGFSLRGKSAEIANMYMFALLATFVFVTHQYFLFLQNWISTFPITVQQWE